MARGKSRKNLMTIEMVGPFFQGDPKKTYRRNVRDLMDEIARVGEDEVRARLKPGPSATSAGPYIKGHTTSIDPPGRRWAGYAVISATDKSLPSDGEIQRWVMALLSGRRIPTVTRTYGKPHSASYMGRYIGTTVGAKGRQAFSSAVSALKRVAKRADLFRGL